MITHGFPMRASSWLALGLVILMCGVPLFIGLDRTDLRNDEAIYSYAVQSVIETGDWLNPRSSPWQHDVFLEKPPLKFWIVALPIRVGLLPNDEFGLRVWDAVFGLAAFAYVFLLGRRMGGPVAGWVASLVLFTMAPLVFVHGLRENVMEAPLLLAYCGGTFHFLSWTDGESRRSRRLHAGAASAYAWLGLMTKFVAIAFLPLSLGVAAMLHAPTRRRVLGAWRLWTGCALAVALCAAPWFVYQMATRGWDVWRIMLGTHVVERFTGALDPTHLKPWHYYVQVLWLDLAEAGTNWLALAGLLWVAVRTLRARWLDGLVLLSWLVVPVALISIGTSKLEHYAYPYFVPPALAAGVLVAAVADWLVERAWSQPLIAGGLDRVRLWWRSLSAAPRVTGRLAVVCRWVLVAAAVALMAKGVAVLAWGPRLTVFGMRLIRQDAAVPLFVGGLALLVLAGEGRAALRTTVLVLALAILPFPAYRAMMTRLKEVDHPLRDTAACMAQVFDRDAVGAQSLRPLIFDLPGGAGFRHEYFFYLRRFGWEEKLTLSQPRFNASLDGTEPRPMLLYAPRFEDLAARADAAGLHVPRPLVHGDARLVLPGPLEACAPQ